MSLDAVVRHTWETIELPGHSMDYHFALQSAVTELWRRRRTAPHALYYVEVFGLLDVDLAEAAPDAVSFDHIPGEDRTFVQIQTLQPILTMYVRDGAYRDALELARRGERLGQHSNIEDLAERVAALDAEATA